MDDRTDKKKPRLTFEEFSKTLKGKCEECKWWIEQGPRTKALGLTPTVIGWCKRMPHTETDKDQDDYCGEFRTIDDSD